MSSDQSITREISAEPTYDYHGGNPPPKATDKVVKPAEVEEDLKG